MQWRLARPCRIGRSAIAVCSACLVRQSGHLGVGDAPIFQGLREGMPPPEPSKHEDQSADVVGWFCPRTRPSRAAARSGGVRSSPTRPAWSPRGTAMSRENHRSRARPQTGVTIHIQDRHFFGLGIAAFAGGVGSRVVDEFDGRPARGQRDHKQCQEQRRNDPVAAPLRASRTRTRTCLSFLKKRAQSRLGPGSPQAIEDLPNGHPPNL